MYWLRSLFTVESVSDLENLARLYDGVSGEIEEGILVNWCQNPFQQAIQRYTGGTVDLKCRLVGPQTLRAVSLKIKENRPKPRDDLLKDQEQLLNDAVREIEQDVQREMQRENDRGCIRDWTAVGKIESLNDLFDVCCLCPSVDFIFRTSRGFVVANTKSVYNTWVPFQESKSDGTSSLMYDKDDGFTSAFASNDKADNDKTGSIHEELKKMHASLKVSRS